MGDARDFVKSVGEKFFLVLFIHKKGISDLISQDLLQIRISMKTINKAVILQRLDTGCLSIKLIRKYSKVFLKIN